MSALFDRFLQDFNDTLGNETQTNVTVDDSTAPSGFPTIDASNSPSSFPTFSIAPSFAPSAVPSFLPTGMPSESPSLVPTTEEQGLVSGSQDSDLENSVRIYGGLFVVVMILFCWARKKFPRCYNVRGWVENLRSPLADEQYGFYDWIWKLNSIEEKVMMVDTFFVGVDSTSLLR